MTNDGLGKTFGYSSENLLTGASGGVTLSYDPGMRLYQTAGAATTRFGYDGTQLIAEYNASNAMQRRFVHGPGVDEPIVQYEGSGTSDRRFLHSDERGSIVAQSDSSGSVIGVNKYDEFGQPQGPSGAGTLLGRFGYTGQILLPEIGLYHYKARMYHPIHGRFVQPDPVGYSDGMNIYAGMRGDPINKTDPTGLCNDDGSPRYEGENCEPIIVTAKRSNPSLYFDNGNYAAPGGGGGGGGDTADQCYPTPGTLFPSNEEAMAAGARAAESQRQNAGDKNERYWSTYELRFSGGWFAPALRGSVLSFSQIGSLPGCNIENPQPMRFGRGAAGIGHSHIPDCGSGLSEQDVTSAGEFFSTYANASLFGLTDQDGTIRAWEKDDNLSSKGKKIGKVCK